jgi:hypothetical protein
MRASTVSDEFGAMLDFARSQKVSFPMSRAPWKEAIHLKVLKGLVKVQAQDFKGSIPLFKEALSDMSLSPRARSRIRANLAFVYFDLFKHFKRLLNQFNGTGAA